MSDHPYPVPGDTPDGRFLLVSKYLSAALLRIRVDDPGCMAIASGSKAEIAGFGLDLPEEVWSRLSEALPKVETMAAEPISPYAASKVAGEAFLRAYSASYPALDTVATPALWAGTLALVLGLLVRFNAVVSAVLFLGFVIGIASAWARGLQIDCGCFGGGGYDADATEKYPWEIARDLGLLFVSLWLVRRPRSRWALDNRLVHESTTDRTMTGEPTR